MDNRDGRIGIPPHRVVVHIHLQARTLRRLKKEPVIGLLTQSLKKIEPSLNLLAVGQISGNAASHILTRFGFNLVIPDIGINLLLCQRLHSLFHLRAQQFLDTHTPALGFLGQQALISEVFRLRLERVIYFPPQPVESGGRALFDLLAGDWLSVHGRNRVLFR